MARRADREREHHRRRHRHRQSRRRHAFGPRHAHGQHRHLELASKQIIEKGKRIAARLLDSDPSQIAFEDGRFSSDERHGALGRALRGRGRGARLPDLPEDLRGPLAAFADETVNDASFPYGCHVCEVEVDPELGTVEIVRYAAVDDAGRAVNPLIIHGQTHGGIAQGVGQALLEHCYYDPSSGQLLSGSFMDYAMPRADNFPFFRPISAKCRARRIRSACAPPAKAAPRRRSAW